MRIPGVGIPELLILLVILLLLFGPKQIPKLAKMFGKAAKDLKDGFEGSDDESPQQAIPPAPAEQNEAKTPSKKEETTS